MNKSEKLIENINYIINQKIEYNKKLIEYNNKIDAMHYIWHKIDKEIVQILIIKDFYKDFFEINIDKKIEKLYKLQEITSKKINKLEKEQY